jgi:serine/threonine-protein kinase
MNGAPLTDAAQIAADPLIGVVLDGRYELTEFIAKGGMGKVYKANQQPLDRVVAIKLLGDVTEGIEDFQRRFFLEASLCSRLTHRNIVRIFDYGCHDDALYYIAMEYLHGQTLKGLIKDAGPMEPFRCIAILKQICAALIEAHGAGLVHGDLKPENLFVVPDALGNEFIKVLDFGVVKEVGAQTEDQKQQKAYGSPAYMSPEQIELEDLDGRSDLYSLGVILFQLISGTLPFRAADSYRLLVQHLLEAPPTFAEINPSLWVSEELESVVQRALRKSRDERFSSALEMLEALEVAETALSQARPRGKARAGLLARVAAKTVSFFASSPAQETPSPELARRAMAQRPTISHEIPPLGAVPEPCPAVPPEPEPPIAASTESTTPSVANLVGLELDGFVAYIDFSCPYCFALFERLTRWKLADKIEWCMVEHALHILDGPFDLEQEQMLSTEVIEVHHRAPDVELTLPNHRCRSTRATRLTVLVGRQFPDQVNAFRQAVYRTLWQQGTDISEDAALQALLAQLELPVGLLGECDAEPPELTASQADWETGDYDASIPVLTHPSSGRVLIGLADEATLVEFFAGERTRVVDNTVCYYQRKPTLVVCGWMSHLWPLLSDVRGSCEILQAPGVQRAREILSELAVPDLLIIESEDEEADQIEELGALARSRGVPWVVATRAPDSDDEVRFLSAGAVEYLPLSGDCLVARARLARILRDRYNMERMQKETRTDALTRLPARHTLLERLEGEWSRALSAGSPLSFVLLDLDGFKAYNKSHGYLTGDQSLVLLADRLKAEMMGTVHVLSRFGGNEFAVLLPNTAEAAAGEIATRLQDAVAAARIENRASESGGFLTVSVGAHTVIPSETASIHAFVDGATRDLQASRRPR